MKEKPLIKNTFPLEKLLTTLMELFLSSCAMQNEDIVEKFQRAL